MDMKFPDRFAAQSPLTSPLDDEESASQAADWLARQDAGFTPAEKKQFERWLASDPRHAVAVAEITDAWALVNRPKATGRASLVLHELAARDRRRRRRRQTFGFASAVLAAAAALVLSSLPFRAPAPADAIPPTVVVRPDRQMLADGSVVDLNAGTDILVEFSATRRFVRLVRGEAHFAVAKDPARSFVVSAGGIEVRAVGTEFTVRCAPQEIDVLVTEGRVAVARPAASLGSAAAAPADPAPVYIAAGGRGVIPANDAELIAPRLEQITRAEIDAALAWRGKRVEFTGTRLAEVVALFNRRNRVQLSLDDPSLGELRVSGIYWIDDPEGFARLLPSTFDLQAVQRRDSAIVFRKPR